MKQILYPMSQHRYAAPWRLALATATLALAGAALQPAFAQPVDGSGGSRPEQMRGHERGHDMGRMLDAVSATAAQRSQIKQITEATRTDLKPVHEASRQLRQQTRALFAMPAVDANAAEGLRQQELVLHDQSTKRMLQARLDISAVLTPEQRQLLADKMATKRTDGAARHGGRMQRP